MLRPARSRSTTGAPPGWAPWREPRRTSVLSLGERLLGYLDLFSSRPDVHAHERGPA
ncbi:Hypothetical protein A7982_05271 [Minicystis rosea]|nr:Hypothetical protein A7982_05271 [Minicystis rosea]